MAQWLPNNKYDAHEGSSFIKLLCNNNLLYKTYDNNIINSYIFHFKRASSIHNSMIYNKKINSQIINFSKKLNQKIEKFNSLPNIEQIYNIIKENNINLTKFNEYIKNK